jgi:hypothetical protein
MRLSRTCHVKSKFFSMLRSRKVIEAAVNMSCEITVHISTVLVSRVVNRITYVI